ncbi:MAG TPA: hypothetical protein VFT86_08080 [Gaiellaceae bacterium]|nr:hypothetical protein [Gaiellaceae bacterium]
MRATVMYGAEDVRVEDLPDVLEGRIEPGRVFIGSFHSTTCPTATAQ